MNDFMFKFMALRELYYDLLKITDKDEFTDKLRESRCPKEDACCGVRTHKTKDSKM